MLLEILSGEEGGELAEVAVILFFVVLVVIPLVIAFGARIKEMFQEVIDALG